MIYFDNAATTKPCAEAIEAAAKNMAENYGNASSLHKMGIEAEKVLISAKKSILSRLSLEGEIYFTSGATESNNTALFGVTAAHRHDGKKIVTTAMEHPSVSRSIDKLEENGYEIVRLSPKDYSDFERAIIDAVDENTVMASFMAVNNETGFKIDVKRVYDGIKLKNPKCTVHIDAVQGFTKVPLQGDIITLSAHKIHGPKGVGALYVKKGVRFLPIVYGGEQQKGLRPGTEPVDLIAGFGAAVDACPSAEKLSEIFSAVSARIKGGLTALDGVKLNVPENMPPEHMPTVPNIISAAVAGVRSEIMLHFLEEKGIYISSGSACAKGKKSGVLDAFGVNSKDADGTLRISLSRYNTIGEADELISAVAEGIKRFRR